MQLGAIQPINVAQIQSPARPAAYVPTAPTSGNEPTQAPESSPLSADNLKKYAPYIIGAVILFYILNRKNNLQMLISKDTLIGAAALGAGAVAAKVVQKKVVPMVLPTASDTVKNLITLGAGIITPQLVKGPIGTGLGAGMIAASVAGLVDPYLQRAGVTGMGEVLMGEVSAEPVPLMGASDIFTAPSNDFTAGGSGEMDY